MSNVEGSLSGGRNKTLQILVKSWCRVKFTLGFLGNYTKYCIYHHIVFFVIIARGGHSIVKLNTTCELNINKIYIEHHQNGSKFYQNFSRVIYIVKYDNHI